MHSGLWGRDISYKSIQVFSKHDAYKAQIIEKYLKYTISFTPQNAVHKNSC